MADMLFDTLLHVGCFYKYIVTLEQSAHSKLNPAPLNWQLKFR